MGGRAGTVVNLRLWFALTFGLALFAREANAHPIHTSITEITHDAPRRKLRVVVRVYSDDFLATLQLGKGVQDWRPAAAEYLSRTLVIQDAAGVALRFSDCGSRAAGDALLICLEAPGELRRLQVRNRIMFEKFDDQLNIVRVTGKRAQTFLLTRRSDSAVFW